VRSQVALRLASHHQPSELITVFCHAYAAYNITQAHRSRNVVAVTLSNSQNQLPVLNLHGDALHATLRLYISAAEVSGYVRDDYGRCAVWILRYRAAAQLYAVVTGNSAKRNAVAIKSRGAVYGLACNDGSLSNAASGLAVY
jgi:hypothetical protein